MEPTRLNPESITDNRCENCSFGFKTKDSKYCERCSAILRRKTDMTPERAEKIILNVVEPRYCFAKLDDLGKPLKEKLLNIEPRRDLYLHGPAGTGKTYAMAALIRHFVYQGYKCMRMNFDDFRVVIRSTYSKAAEKTEWMIIEPYKQADKLFIEDLGLSSKAESEHAYHTLYSLLNTRQERNLPTYFSSNKDLAKIERAFDSRIVSRLRLALVVEMDGPDRREH